VHKKVSKFEVEIQLQSPAATYPNLVTTATVTAVKWRKHLQQPTAAGIAIPLEPFDSIASVTNLALLLSRKLGPSDPVSLEIANE
jgi:hypothetical protein